MQEYTNKITSDVYGLMDTLDAQLSLDYIAYDIEFQGKKFHFGGATTMQESEKLQEDKREFIQLLLSDAFYKLLKDQDENAWEYVLQFKAQSREEVASPISKEQYAEAKQIAAEKAKAVNLESIYVNMEREDWSEDKSFALIMKKEEKNE